jgi:protein-tyrosine phosphatase
MNSSVLFVCLGNICRSPLAEGAFRTETERRGLDFETDSAGTGGWHVGRAPDPRAIAVAARHGIDISQSRARQIQLGDFHRFDHIVALDSDNLRELRDLQPADGRARLSLLLDHVEGREGEAVADPYYGNEEYFVRAWRDVTQAAGALVRKLAAEA